MNIKTTLKSSVAAVALLAIAAPAQADTVDSGKDAKVTISGHFNKAIMWADTGSASDIIIGDNDVSQSRFRINAATSLNEALSVRGHMEAGFNENQLGSASIADQQANGEAATGSTSGGDNADASVRKTYIEFNHKQFGKLTLGKDSEASDGKFVGAPNPAGNAVDAGAVLGGGLDLQANNAADNVFSGNTVGDFVQGIDGTNRNGIHYDSPTFGGFQAQASYGDDQSVALGASFGGKFGGFAVDAGIGYEMLAGSSSSVDSLLMFSGGVTHDSGFSIGGGWGEENNTASGTAEGEIYYVVVGYEADLIAAGSTGFAVQYLSSDKANGNDGDELTSIQLGVEQGMGMGVTGYAGLQFTEIETTGTSYEDVTTFITGARINF